MEFPLTEWHIFPAEDFDLAAPTLGGGLVAEVLAQIRPNGRIVDNWRVALGGDDILEASVDLAYIIPAAATLPKWRLSWDAWPRDIQPRKNMTSTSWVDVADLIASNDASVSDENGDNVAAQQVAEGLASLPARAMKSAALRWLVAASDDGRLELHLQCLPASTNNLDGRPIFRRLVLATLPFLASLIGTLYDGTSRYQFLLPLNCKYKLSIPLLS